MFGFLTYFNNRYKLLIYNLIGAKKNKLKIYDKILAETVDLLELHLTPEVREELKSARKISGLAQSYYYEGLAKLSRPDQPENIDDAVFKPVDAAFSADPNGVWICKVVMNDPHIVM